MTNNKKFELKYNKIILFSLFLFLFSTPTIIVKALNSSYATDDHGLKAGMVVALSESSTAEEPKVERAALGMDSRIIGVSTTQNSQLISVNTNNSKIYVQNSGEVTVFVSDINGNLKKGDLLAPSPLLGVLMKADERTAPVIGIAIENFDYDGSELKEIKNEKGVQQNRVSSMRINLDHRAASNQYSDNPDSSLERLGRALTGKDVGEIQVVAALAIFLIVLVAEGGIIYGAISSSITAVGRNPLAGNTIKSEMIRVIGIALMVLVIGASAMYAILWI